ncbi:MAG: hypothetical protein AMS18_00625 [Gemmatimonas sp. SG8_17]|nr:MAG: hypothetical protein AMS18_00625 [Gemmatimonas sp. SG8_17]
MIRAFPVAVCCLLILSGLTTGQDSQIHEGFWIGFGLGVGMNPTDGHDDDPLIGGSGYFRAGGTLNQRVKLGGEALGWAREQHDDVITHGNVMFVAILFPQDNSGLFLKGGVGIAGVTRVAAEGGRSEIRTEGGLGTTVGLGFDVHLGRQLSLTPNVDWVFQLIDTAIGPAYAKATFVFTLGLTWH